MRRLRPSYLSNQRGNLDQGSWGRTVLLVAQTIGTIAVTAYGGPWAGAAVAVAHAAFWGLYDTINADGTVNKQETLADLRIQTSTLGQTMPQVFGNGSRLSGNIIWATDKIPHEHRQSQNTGGKGGGGGETVTVSKTYTISLAVALCDTRVSGPVPSLLRAWKNTNEIAVPGNWTFYSGTSTQLPDPTMEAVIGVGNVPGYRYTCYIVMTDEELGPSGQLPQWSFEIAQNGVPMNNLDTIVTQLCGAAGLSGPTLDVTGLPTAQVALTLTSIEAVRASLEQLSFAYRFYGLESGEQYVWRSIGTGGIVATIAEADGSAGDDRATETGAQLDRAAPLELPTVQYLTYIDQAQHYQRNTQPSAVVLPPSGHENPKNITTPLVLSANQARRLSTELVALAWVQREPYADTLSRRYCFLEPGDKVNLMARGITYPVLLGATTYGAPGVVEVQGRVNGAPRLGSVTSSQTQPVDTTLRDATTIPPGAVAPPGTQNPQAVGDTTPLLLNLPVLDSGDQSPRYHVGYIGDNEPWEGGALYRSVDGSATFQALDAGALEAITGVVTLALPIPANHLVLDTTTTFQVTLEYGTLSTINDTALAAGVQRAMIGNELVYIGIATLTAPRQYNCSRLWRARQGTDWALLTHANGDPFVLIDSAIHRIPMSTTERGISFPFKAVTRGQSLAAATPVSFTPTAENLIPWRPLIVNSSRPVDTWQLRWLMQSRFVPGGIDPDFVGFRVQIFEDVTLAVVKRTVFVTGGYPLEGAVLKGWDGYTPALQMADFGSIPSEIYWAVAQVGAYATSRNATAHGDDLVSVQAPIEPPPETGVLDEIYVTGTTVALAVNTRYILDNASLVVATLPATAELFDVIELVGKGAGKFKVAQNASQRIHAGGKVTTTGVTGYLQVNHAKDAVTLECIVAGASTEWSVTSFA